MRTVYVNGRYLDADQARISIFDRGLLFGDAVYEVSSVLNGKLVDNDAHLARLHRSLGELEIKAPLPDAEIAAVQQELIDRNHLREGCIYLQVSRGIEDREFTFSANLDPSLIMFTQARSLIAMPMVESGIRVKTVEDIRWQRRDIKTTMLLAASLAKQKVSRQGYDDAWMVEEGVITEGTSNNAYIIDQDNRIYTRPPSNRILNGITRRAVNRLALEHSLEVIEQTFTVEQALAAKEAFSTSATTFVMPVVEIDDIKIGSGAPGASTLKLRQLYIDMATGRK